MAASLTLAGRIGRAGAVWRDGWRDWRNRLVASPRFQRLSADLPFVRRIAAGQAGALFDICAGFVYSQVLLAAVRLNLFDILADRPLDLADLAPRLGLEPEQARRLVDATVALGLVERRSGGRYGLGMLGAALRGNPGLAAMIDHHGLVYGDLADPVGLLRARPDETALGRFWPYAAGAGTDPAAAERYSRLMSATQGFVQGDILDAYDFGRHRRVLDVGGGDGTFVSGLAARFPGVGVQLFDLPPVAALAATRLAAAGLDPAGAVPGDFRRDPLPTGADLVSFVRILHDHDDATVRHLLAAAHAALPPGGRVMIAEPLARTAGSARMGDAYFGFYLMAMGRGRPRSAEDLSAALATAGFVRPRPVRTRRPMLVSILVADKA